MKPMTGKEAHDYWKELGGMAYKSVDSFTHRLKKEGLMTQAGERLWLTTPDQVQEFFNRCGGVPAPKRTTNSRNASPSFNCRIEAKPKKKEPVRKPVPQRNGRSLVTSYYVEAPAPPPSSGSVKPWNPVAFMRGEVPLFPKEKK